MAILCHCHGVNERTIRRTVERGASSIDEVGEGCRAGTSCGACWAWIDQILAERSGAAGTAVAVPGR